MPLIINSPFRSSIVPWDLTGFVYDSSFDLTPYGAGFRPTGIDYNDDGTKAYVSIVDSGSLDRVMQFSLSTPYDFATAVYDSKFLDVSNETLNPSGGSFNNNGTKWYVLSAASPHGPWTYQLTIPYDISTAVYNNNMVDVSNVVLADHAGYPSLLASTDVEFNDSGTKMYVTNGGNGDDGIYEFNLLTPYTVSTATYSQFLAAEVGNTPSGMKFQSGGFSMIVSETNSDVVVTYTLTSAYDISTATVDPVSIVTSSEDTLPYGLAMNPAGDQLFVCGFAGQDINKYVKV